MAGSKNSQPKVNLKNVPLHRAAKPGTELQSWQQASPKQEQGHQRTGDARCPCGCRTIRWERYHFGSRGWKSLPLPFTAAVCYLPARTAGIVASSVLERGRSNVPSGEPRLAAAGGDPHLAAPSAAQLRCGVKRSPRERLWERDVISAKIPKTARQTSPQGFSPWGSLLKKALFFQRGRTRFSLSAGALEIVSRWALEKQGSPGCESLWKPPSELFVAASLIFHATRY